MNGETAMKLKFCKENENVFNQVVKNIKEEIAQKNKWEQAALNYLRDEHRNFMGSEYREGQEKYDSAWDSCEEERKNFCQSNFFNYSYWENIIKEEINKHPLLSGGDWEGTKFRLSSTCFISEKFFMYALADILFIFDKEGDIYINTDKIDLSFSYGCNFRSNDINNPYGLWKGIYLSMNAKHKEWSAGEGKVSDLIDIIKKSEQEIWDELDYTEHENFYEHVFYIHKEIKYNPYDPYLSYQLSFNDFTTNKNGAYLYYANRGI